MYKERYEFWLNNVKNKEEKEELLSIKDNEKEIKERFSLDLAFGTAGMRGTIALGTYNMNNYTVIRATKGLSEYIKQLGNEACNKGVVISYDVRRYSFEFALTAAKVLAQNKINVFLFENVRPVPMCSFAIRHLNAIAGIMITASHNPKEYNGYKVYGEDGAQLDLEATKTVVTYIEKIKSPFDIELKNINIKHEDILDKDDYKIDNYITIIGNTIDNEFYNAIDKQILSKESIKKASKDFKIIYTPIHGTGAIPVTKMFGKMGLNYDVVKEQFMPDQEFSTVQVPNPENHDALDMAITLAKNSNANTVIGTDPDCDRMGVAVKDDNDKFSTITGNEIGCIMLYYELLRRRELQILPKNGAVVKTIVTTKMADKIAESFGVKVFNTLTGFKFIGEKIKEWEKTKEYKYIFGFEESYGFLAGEHARDKDAVVASAVFADLTCYFKEKDKTVYNVLQDLKNEYGYFIEKSKSIVFKGLNGMQEMKDIMKKLIKDRITKIEDFEIDSIEDIKNSKKYNKDGSEEDILLPSSDVIKYNLNDYEWLAVRPSGTEPKLKIYVSVCEDSNDKAIKKADKLMSSILSIIEG